MSNANNALARGKLKYELKRLQKEENRGKARKMEPKRFVLETHHGG